MQIFLCESFRFLNDGNERKLKILCGSTDISEGHMQAKEHVDRGICEKSQLGTLCHP